ncbi:MAG: prolyl oligopeptidase family serine peptidase [Candidatus Latescibacteria bacterium]|nr:prolyl oligopeptidase family serine peptidase [Candidatus Latescibacterota bacterium]NIM21804.1 prolyl oligopeptidase family serine peptidase [Candidatus Latescibacterota bacterium]NIM65942.1 prolyl oligopeptidase family serine peptidase [Candidatus Latescibacterota bacterium]NIO02687.1 prolyl oligopeptidase family serine peptidase [Candidatus Latescibacterota bacterium]NIO29668.1 prolyl oligopeptidase family serine peptidase [Candidatus Latescibacterota bacterium]
MRALLNRKGSPVSTPRLLKSLFLLVVIVTVAGIVAATLVPTAAAKKYKYPKAHKVDVVDDFHGTKVADPYRWLEDPDAEETIKWVEAQNELFYKYIDTPSREKIKKRIEDIWNYPKYTLPYKKGDRYFFSKNDGLQNQYVYYMQESLDSEPKVVIDPNTLSEDGTIALRSRSLSEDAALLAYGLSSKGSDWQDVRIRKVDSGEDYGDLLKWTKFTSIAWKHDNSGFYYNRFPDPSTLPDEDHTKYNRVYWHKLGTPQLEDKLVYGPEEQKELGFYPDITDDGKYLLLHVWHGTDDRNGIYYRPVASDGEFIRLMEVGEAEFDPIDNVGSVFYFETNLDAPRGRVIAVDVENAGRENWKEIIPQVDDVIDFVTMVNDQLVIAYSRDAHHVLKIFDRKGKFIREIELPTIGAIYGISGRREDTEMFFSFTSFVYPSTAFRYDFKKDKVTVFRKPEVAFDPTQYETKQVFYSSKDGTRVPMFITHKKNLKLNGDNPTILYGYGGFNVSLMPYFSITRLIWMENGGVYAIANLRGGSEYGEEWHQAGMMEKRQNVFDDFIAAAEWLIDNDYSNSSKLAINGASNGGLLVAACMVQRPELFGAVVSDVPVTDMLRYHKFTVGRYWVPELGNAEENPEHFKFLYAYSPLHNIKKGIVCPPTLVTSADTDDRVVPMHAKKFVAALQESDAGENPILLRVETKAGHGGGKPTSKRIEEASDIYAFLFKTFGMTMASGK